MFVAIGKPSCKPNCKALYLFIVKKIILALEEELGYYKIIAELDEMWGLC